eukprot:TRINITY_DN2156_c0_g3_i2.p1 TRINITY_DN2156_c0_g3~~TRINITY_DN2156_c0_g3_i2.p1  ORF type:complete len:512 (-),score=154.19 TRINITY_DN2156_c0_g3_i2:21-1556(-)
MEHPWDDLEKYLKSTFDGYCAAPDEFVDWGGELFQLRKVCVQGMAVNSPQPVPAPTSPKYPPLVILNQVMLWLKKLDFPTEDKSKILESPFVYYEDLRNYILGLLNVMGFIINQISQQGDMHDHEDDAADETNEWLEGVAEVTDVNDEKQQQPQDTHSNTENNAKKPSTNNNTNSSIPQEGETMSSYESRIAQVADPLGPLAAEVLTRIVTGAYLSIQIEKESPSTKSLYDKYKRMQDDSGISSNPLGQPNTSGSGGGSGVGSIDIIESMNQCVARLSPPFQEIYGRSKSARAILKGTKGVEHTWYFRNSKNRHASMIYQLANTIDEEILVLHPATQQGYIVNVEGCTDNKIFSIGLCSELFNPGDDDPDLIKGVKPPEDVSDLLFGGTEQMLDETVQWACPFVMSNWMIVSREGTMPTGMSGASNWLWTDGSPNEIARWPRTNQRVVILSKAPFPRKFTPIRVFKDLTAKVEIIKVLKKESVSNYMNEFSQVSDQVKSEAIKAHKKWQDY